MKAFEEESYKDIGANSPRKNSGYAIGGARGGRVGAGARSGRCLHVRLL